MKLVYAPDSYGGFLSAVQACERFKAAWEARALSREHELCLHPMADGGEGLVDVLAWHIPCERRLYTIVGPEGRLLGARVAMTRSGVFVESAEVIGLAGLEGPPRCLELDSGGLGRLLARLVAEGVEGPIRVGLGGTATMDGGLGALQALGFRAWDAQGRLIPEGSAATLAEVASLSGRSLLEGYLLELLVDVETPLLRAPATFGPQKGLEEASIPGLESAFLSWARVLGEHRRSRALQELPLDLPGGGAAGGLGFALASALDARLRSGARVVARLSDLSASIDGASMLVLGEGRLDATSFEGKVARLLLDEARRLGVEQVAALVGCVRSSLPPPSGPDLIFEAGGPPDLGRFDAAIDRLLDAFEQVSSPAPQLAPSSIETERCT